MIDKGFYIRKNTKELRERIEELGIPVCKCTEFPKSCWLHIDNNELIPISCHGIGFEDETYPLTQEQQLKQFVKDTKDIDCKEDEQMFLALTALLASEKLTKVDDGCWYANDTTSRKGAWCYVNFKNPCLMVIRDIISRGSYHKASQQEIITYFSELHNGVSKMKNSDDEALFVPKRDIIRSIANPK